MDIKKIIQEEIKDFDWVKEIEPKFDVDDSKDYQGWWKHFGQSLIMDLGLYDFEGSVESCDWSGYVRVISNYGYFYYETSGLTDDNCPEEMFMLHRLYYNSDGQKIKNVCNPFKVFGDFIKSRIG